MARRAGAACGEGGGDCFGGLSCWVAQSQPASDVSPVFAYQILELITLLLQYILQV